MSKSPLPNTLFLSNHPLPDRDKFQKGWHSILPHMAMTRAMAEQAGGLPVVWYSPSYKTVAWSEGINVVAWTDCIAWMDTPTIKAAGDVRHTRANEACKLLNHLGIPLGPMAHLKRSRQWLDTLANHLCEFQFLVPGLGAYLQNFGEVQLPVRHRMLDGTQASWRYIEMMSLPRNSADQVTG